VSKPMQFCCYNDQFLCTNSYVIVEPIVTQISKPNMTPIIQWNFIGWKPTPSISYSVLLSIWTTNHLYLSNLTILAVQLIFLFPDMAHI
jgi:hypothetical protein